MYALVPTRYGPVEVHVTQGLPCFGVAPSCEGVSPHQDTTRDRVRAAMLSTGLAWPLQRIMVQLPGASLIPDFDVPIALGIVAATDKRLAPKLAGRTFSGELALNGLVRGSLARLANRTLADMIDSLMTAPVILPPVAQAREHEEKADYDGLSIVEAEVYDLLGQRGATHAQCMAAARIFRGQP